MQQILSVIEPFLSHTSRLNDVKRRPVSTSASQLLQLLVLSGVLFFCKTSRLTAQRHDADSHPWVSYDASYAPGHRLQYRTTESGDRIMDFSSAGYMGGGVPIPKVAVKAVAEMRVTAAGSEREDYTAYIQALIDSVSRLPLKGGHRGAVYLAAGIYPLKGTLHIDSSGVVLRGSGARTVLKLAGEPHTAIEMGGKVMIEKEGPLLKVRRDYIASGTNRIVLQEVSRQLQPGDEVLITKPVTPSWIHFMGMDSLSRNGKKETWLSGDLTTIRAVQRVTGKEIGLAVPLSDSYDPRFTGAGVTVQKIRRIHEPCQIGLEQFSIQAPAQQVTIDEPHFSGIRSGSIADSWIRDLTLTNTVNSVTVSGRRMTLERISILHELPTKGSAKPADFSANGSQLLFNDCRIKGDNVFYLATGARVTGPIVLLHCLFEGKGWIQPHQRWATGILIDNCQVPDGAVDFMNRGEMGSGHGWTVGWAVAWNSEAAGFTNQNPPGALNFVIGCTGSLEQKAMPFNKSPLIAPGVYESQGKAVSPKSLYLMQLKERLGAPALKAAGYVPGDEYPGY